MLAIVLTFDVDELGWGLEKFVDLGVEGSPLNLGTLVGLGIYLRKQYLFFFLGKLLLGLGHGRVVVDGHFDSSIRGQFLHGVSVLAQSGFRHHHF